VWQVTFLGDSGDIDVPQLTGASVIIVGSCLSVQLKTSEKNCCSSPKQLEASATEITKENSWRAKTKRKSRPVAELADQEVEFAQVFSDKSGVGV